MWIGLSVLLGTGFLLRMVCLVSLISTADERSSRHGCDRGLTGRDLCDDSRYPEPGRHPSPSPPSEPLAVSKHLRPTRVRKAAQRSRRTYRDFTDSSSNVIFPHFPSASAEELPERTMERNEIEGAMHHLPAGSGKEEADGTTCSQGRPTDATQRRRKISRLPAAIVIGVKKGGTRALLEFLKVNPDIRAPGPETHFFDRKYYRGLEWYRSLMPETAEGQVTVEKTPSYFVTTSVPTRVHNMSSSVKLIVVVRDPVTRAISDYTQAATKRRPTGGEPLSFERMAFLGDNATGPVATSWGAVRIGLYARHLERWLRHFPIGQFHFVHGERLVDDPAAEVRLIEDFLGVRRFVTGRHFYFNATKGFPCLRKLCGRRRGGAPRCLGKTKGRVHPVVDERVLQRLRHFYRPFNEKFYRMTGINFGWS